MERLTPQEKELVNDNLGLVYYMVKRRHQEPQAQEDAFYQGLMGLFKAAKTYRPGNGPFSSWACRLIAQALLRAIVMERTRQQRHRRIWIVRRHQLGLLDGAVRRWLGVSRPSLMRMIRPHLTQDERVAVYLFKLKGWSCERIGELYKPPLTKGGILHRVKASIARLRRHFTREDLSSISPNGTLTYES